MTQAEAVKTKAASRNRDTPIRVVQLHYRDDPEAGGSLRVGEHLANHVDPDEVEAHVLFAYGDEGPVAQAATVPCHYPQVDGRWDVRGWMRARRIIQDIAPDILHFQDPLTTLRLFLVDYLAVMIKHCHGRPLEPGSWREQLKRRWRRYQMDRFVCIDPVAAETMQEYGFAGPDQCSVLPNAVDVDVLQDTPSKEEARSELGLPEDVRLLGMVGRLIEPIGFPDLFRLLQKLPSDWHALFAGGGGERGNMERKAEKQGVRSRIHLLGALDDVRPAYAAMDAYVFLSQHEPFGLVMAEAMACGVPLFGLHGLGEYREIDPPLVNDQVATFFERENPERFLDPSQQSIPEPDPVLDRLRDALLSFDPKSAEARRQVEAAREHVRAHFDAPIQARRMTRIYKELIPSDHGSEQRGTTDSRARN